MKTKQYQQINRVGKANPALSFWEDIKKFRTEADLDILDSENLLNDIRDRSIGREVKLDIFINENQCDTKE